MRNIKQATVVVALLSTYVGISFAQGTPQIESASANKNKGSKSGWVKVEGNDFVTGYADPSTIIKAGDKVKMQALVDFKTVSKSGGHQYLSARTQHEYDCKESKWRMLNFSYHAENMGKGKTVYSDTGSGNWVPVMQGSGTQFRWKIACEK